MKCIVCLSNLVKIEPARSEYKPTEMTVLELRSFSKNPAGIEKLKHKQQVRITVMSQ